MENKAVKVEKVVQNDCFEIRKISLEKGAKLPPHTSPKDAFLQMLSGHIQFHIHEAIHELKKNESLSFSALETHQVVAIEAAQFLIIR